MPPACAGIAARPILQTPLAVFDFETTGLTPGYDRVVEISVIRIDPREGEAPAEPREAVNPQPRVVLNTLVNPRRRMAATEIHGITEDDVADAPPFDEIAQHLLRAITGCVLAAYNVYFDYRFLEFELDRAGLAHSAPHFCLMYLRPMLGLGKRCTLSAACEAHGIPHASEHVSLADSLAAARLMHFYRGVMRKRRLSTFRDLARLKRYKFLDSFDWDPIPPDAVPDALPKPRLKARVTQSDLLAAFAPEQPPPAATAGLPGSALPASRQAIGEYWDTLAVALADLEITDEEVDELDRKRRDLALPDEQVHMLHARAFASAITQFTGDKWLDNRERRKLSRLHHCLSRLGWAPGQ
jgi:DNA polymerase-3 subunit epsilon